MPLNRRTAVNQPWTRFYWRIVRQSWVVVHRSWVTVHWILGSTYRLHDKHHLSTSARKHPASELSNFPITMTFRWWVDPSLIMTLGAQQLRTVASDQLTPSRLTRDVSDQISATLKTYDFWFPSRSVQG